ncbi:MAG: protein-export chaperone SecB [Deltaproteobacteria bacterium]|nr:protein-export chaperone SecB [Deltaproteobacteria bacterium]
MDSPISLKLVSTRIQKLHFEILEEVTSENIVDLKVSLGHAFKYNRKKKQLFVLLAVNVSGEEAPFKINAELEGYFLLNRQATKKVVTPFAEINCSAILFPYVRETIAEITRRAGFEPFHLDSVNFVEFFKKLREADAQQNKSEK